MGIVSEYSTDLPAVVKAAPSQEKITWVQELVENGLSQVPDIYIRPPHDRPGAAQVSDQEEIPIIDLADLFGEDRPRVVEEIGRACEEWGFFQVINHGVDANVIERLRAAAQDFFQKPPEERMLLHNDDFGSTVGYSTSFNTKQETIREWRDSLNFNRFPGRGDGFQEAPDFCRQQLQNYVAGVEKLAGSLFTAMFENLSVKEEDMEAAGVPPLPRLLMSINYYPPCPDPSLTLGLSGHSDVSCLTILQPDEIPGLQVKKGGRWVVVKPAPGAFVINLADQTEILTNGKYKSIEHRAVTNTDKARMSIACFFGPTEESIIAPLPCFIDENHPPRFKPTKFADYVQNFSSNRLLSDRGTLDFARI